MIAYTQEEMSVRMSYFRDAESLAVLPHADCLVTRLLTNGTGALGKLISGARRGLCERGGSRRGREVSPFSSRPCFSYPWRKKHLRFLLASHYLIFIVEVKYPCGKLKYFATPFILSHLMD